MDRTGDLQGYDGPERGVCEEVQRDDVLALGHALGIELHDDLALLSGSGLLHLLYLYVAAVGVELVELGLLLAVVGIFEGEGGLGSGSKLPETDRALVESGVGHILLGVGGHSGEIGFGHSPERYLFLADADAGVGFGVEMLAAFGFLRLGNLPDCWPLADIASLGPLPVHS